MAHTNSTTNYSLPQFITTDKPAWLTDINGAFSDIDTGLYNAQSKADSAYNDAATAQGDASTAITNAAAADAKGSGALASIEAQFDPTTIYAVGAKVIYNNLLYICTTAVVTPGPWTGAANWDRITVDTIIDNTKTAVENEINTLAALVDFESGALSVPTGLSVTISRGQVGKQGRMAFTSFCVLVGGALTSGRAILKLPAGFAASNFTDALGYDVNGTPIRFYISGDEIVVYQNIPAGTYFLNASYITT